MALIIIIMGVSGCGKTTIGRELSTKLDIPFYDGDDFHPQSNIDKMKNNEALNDEDRLPWLQNISSKIQNWKKGKGAIIACSALKESYREILNRSVENIQWTILNGDFNLILNRINQRKNHFMKSELLQSQFETLELPSYGIYVDVSKDIDEIIEEITLKIKTDE
ncbi:gluconokinase [Tenacibaculum adriaticum]|uniref:Gluconokinase n=1 Tax=Tenacibaculum adriaticum TaxID=413713 RepID=A0A5S5DQM7_9FLAO|nr:gluconokinase [Tenacibaculum adriaticum]TYP98187.1 gluconokinase [Tenacibaculum adriaticum]